MRNKESQDKILEVWVKPRASRNEILGYREGYLWIRVAEAPIEGDANRMCGRLLAESLGISPSQVEIVAGFKSRRKRFRIKEINPAVWGSWKILQGKSE